MVKINRENISRHLLEYQLKLANKNIMDIVNDDVWRFNITLTQEQQLQFKNYAVKLIKKVFKCNRSKAVETYTFFKQTFGVRTKN